MLELEPPTHTWKCRRNSQRYSLFKHLKARTEKDKLLIIHRADSGPVITLYYIISKFRWVIRLGINSLHEQVLTSALCISNTAPHQSSTHKSAICVNVHISSLHNSPLSPSQRDQLHFCDALQRTTEPREARERNGWPASCLLLPSTSVDSDLGSGIKFAVSYQTDILIFFLSFSRQPCLFFACIQSVMKESVNMCYQSLFLSTCGEFLRSSTSILLSFKAFQVAVLT